MKQANLTALADLAILNATQKAPGIKPAVSKTSFVFTGPQIGAIQISLCCFCVQIEDDKAPIDLIKTTKNLVTLFSGQDVDDEYYCNNFLLNIQELHIIAKALTVFCADSKHKPNQFFEAAENVRDFFMKGRPL